jgi:hypothetical protein
MAMTLASVIYDVLMVLAISWYGNLYIVAEVLWHFGERYYLTAA